MLTSQSLDPSDITHLEPDNAADAEPSKTVVDTTSVTAPAAAPTSRAPSLARRFDRADYRARPAVPVAAPAIRELAQAEIRAEPEPQPPAPSETRGELTGDALIAADYLRSLGWRREKIERLFRGPRKVSIHEIAGREVDAKCREPVSGTARSEVDGSIPTLAAAKVDKTGTKLESIINAVWEALHGDPSKLVSLADLVTELTAPLQAYLFASLVAGVEAMPGLERWQKKNSEYVKSRRDLQSAAEREVEEPVGSVFTAAATQANRLPVLGADLCKVLLAGVAIREALLFELPAPIRDAASSGPSLEEGKDSYRGLSVETKPAIQRQVIDRDDVAIRLPMPAAGTSFWFVPTLEHLQSAGRELELYEDQDRAINR